jgi:hypothetical protein
VEGAPTIGQTRREACTVRESRSRGSTRISLRKEWAARSFPSDLEPTGGACEDDEARQRSATCKARAAPADEARAVRHSMRREALSPGQLLQEARVGVQALPRSSESARVDRSWLVRIAKPSCPARAARTDAGRGQDLHSATNDSAIRIQCAHNDATSRQVRAFDPKPSAARDDARATLRSGEPERIDRSWLVRIARPSCPARAARTDAG